MQLLRNSVYFGMCVLSDCNFLFDDLCFWPAMHDERSTTRKLTRENLTKAMSELNGGMSVTDGEISAMIEDATTNG
eukprot:COSAG02_NODE_451_length_22060_cov_6.853513_4_plen_76_part_00